MEFKEKFNIVYRIWMEEGRSMPFDLFYRLYVEHYMNEYIKESLSQIVSGIDEISYSIKELKK